MGMKPWRLLAVGAAMCLLFGCNGDVRNGWPGGGGAGGEVCDDGVDNDDDTHVDCRDDDCDGAAACSFTELAAGRSHACGVLGSGNVVCWGFNGEGQIGNGETASEAVAPTVVDGLDDITDVAVGLRHSCALGSDGNVHCWGNNDDGQLGDDSFANSPFPVEVSGVTTATDLSANGLHTCAVTNKERFSRVHCWGANDRKQVGVGKDEETRIPKEVKSLGRHVVDATGVVSGIKHNCAMMPNSRQTGYNVMCWGDNRSGQQGMADERYEQSVAVRVVRQKSNGNAIRNFVEGSLAAGQNSTCAIREGGSVWCWGDGSQGHFGSDALSESQFAAVEYPGLGDAERLWHAMFHVCAERASGRVTCWGDNGQLAFDDESKVHYNPVLLHDVVEPNDVAPGDRFTCWADSKGRAFCQGASDSGQLGTPSLTQATSEPQRVYPEWQ